MDLTQGTFEEKNIRARKMMLWFGMISILMTFGGLTSAYVVSKTRPDWLDDFQLPSAFFTSTAFILVSSVTFHWAKRAIMQGNRNRGTVLLLVTLVLGIAFIVSQFAGFAQIVEDGYYFTGSQSTITTSFLYAITVAHIVHVFAGVIVLLTVIYNHFKEKYVPGQTLGLELGVTFWHFLDFLWLYLILFFFFFR
ncbi:cytochrome c oxidase subunit 3 [Sinomicrobium weinanense]|uniref:Cytochrome c oxidase subunit 3 n=1 Tax=Sinomicrobium weinanense TaxID=2842200 RepID=A0A926JP85_9FLAO|nr:cytochrome c oxidase subunit 3 [Sinomicrobium weinanense]MBC9794839.1 cytochrome c oxidase subunit 3 [Sinomicrobium weinanense]MBU3125610.1 cytochrome c oxidase subunit 3 [Sinomicrobium weinanense]